MGVQKHKLSEIDTVSMKANCAACGPVALAKTNSGARVIYRCIIGRREGRKVSPTAPSFGKYEPKSRHHGLTASENRSFKRDKVCEICGRSKNLVTDHNHVTGSIRGVLCSKHNTAFAYLGDGQTDELIIAMLRYHQKYFEL